MAPLVHEIVAFTEMQYIIYNNSNLVIIMSNFKVDVNAHLSVDVA